MKELHKKIKSLKNEIDSAYTKLGYDKKQSELEAAEAKIAEPGFWDDAQKAGELASKAGALKNRLEPWLKAKADINELQDLAALDDIKLKGEIEQQLNTVEHHFNILKSELKFAGPYDEHGAIVSIFAGAGGTDAQDWAGMLLRMYSKFFEKQGWAFSVLDESVGEEAGLKSVTVAVNDDFAYGNLKSEHGVHRLVRQSPFNADSLRQTSFARVEVLPKIDAPTELEIDEKDLKIDVFRSGGRGGQSVNTTDSAVRVQHLPTGITVSIQNERSQLQNKETALTILRSKLAQLQLEQHKQKLSDIKGPNEQAAWGNQIRNYVLHPYKQVKDLRTQTVSKDPSKVLDGELKEFISAYVEQTLTD